MLLTSEDTERNTGGATVNRPGKDVRSGSPLLLATKKVIMVLLLPPRMKGER